MDEAVMIQELSHKFSDVPLAKNLKRKSISVREPLVVKGQNSKSILENDGAFDRWWMSSKVYPPPKRRSVSAIRRYPQGCGRDLGFTVAGFDSKRVQCEKINVMNGKNVNVDNNCTLDTTHNKVKLIQVKNRCKEKKEEASKTIVPSVKRPSERAKERTCINNQLPSKNSPMKVISKKRVGIKHPVRHESEDVDLEEYGRRAIRQSRNFSSRIPAKKSVSALYRRVLSDIKHHQRVAKKSTTNFGPKKDDRLTDPRAKVKRCLHLFQIISRQLLREVESGKPTDIKRNRIDLRTFSILREQNETLNRDKPVVGAVPGVEVGDEYRYRAEFSVLGLHQPLRGGIGSTLWNGIRIATSIVASGGYSDDIESENVLIYTGAGGKPTGKPGHTEPEDQKLKGGNLALKNSIKTKTPVRVIHGQNIGNSRKETYTYDGLYEVETYWPDNVTHIVKGVPNTVVEFRFRLKRLEGQPELNWSKLKKVQRWKVREGLCSKDISLGREKLPISVINTTDNENLQQFRYITKTVHRPWFQKSRPKGCKCNGLCCNAKTCSCAAKNGGQIPFNFNGAIVQPKTLIYECGPMCGCPSSCYNRVSQHGLKFPLEVFRTNRRGWGVRSLSSIPSGSFVCEYIGELLQDQVAEKRKNDEYRFNIRWPSTDEGGSSSEGYSIDTLEMGNVGQFINHSCSPNLYVQNVLFDHDDKKMPHIMFFAHDNIPPLKELTYDYNYSIGAARYSDSSVKVKECYCGTSECKGRLY
ncbi:histone-lysine N-methyltransferase, H3 lysine-9 specific SUVH4-like protein [Carex littledalei]|uniref:Histone-lysine N-methyltransferase, H3 lysine-9 specific SUVH4-like protein n=1 Tax=Carex littledalei TaxID=544730 RepID=A0A833QKF5_9POAL|nr:histone-lysine N-methyltransferase, H3 lysine-9 specific SUVH4-like protein [Carex littledalei]